MVEFESLTVVKILNSEKGSTCLGVDLLISDALDLVARFRYVMFSYVPWKLNGSTPKLANFGLSSSLDYFWMEETLHFISSNVTFNFQY